MNKIKIKLEFFERGIEKEFYLERKRIYCP